MKKFARDFLHYMAGATVAWRHLPGILAPLRFIDGWALFWAIVSPFFAPFLALLLAVVDYRERRRLAAHPWPDENDDV